MIDEQCTNCILPTQCKKCGRLFDLNQDVLHSGKTVQEVLDDECGASELLCWDCRDCP